MTLGGKALFRLGGRKTYQPDANSEYQEVKHGRHTAGANVRRGEGNNPDQRLKSQSYG